MKRSSRSKKNFIALKQKNDVDKIINFFMSSCWSKTGIFVKLMRKVSMKWKNWRDFRVLHSTQLQEEDWSKIKILSSNSLARCRNCRTKLIAWMIQEIFKMLNQYAVDIPTSMSYSPHPIPGGMLSRSVGMPCRKDVPPSIWDTHGKSGNVFGGPVVSSTAPYPQELNPWSSGISETDSLINGGEEWESNTSSGSVMPVRTVSQKFTHPLWGRLFKELWGRPTTTADFRSSFWQILHANNVCLLEYKIQDWSMYLFTIAYGSYALNQRSGIQMSNLKYSMRRSFQHWTESSIIPNWKERSVWRNKKPKKTDRLPDLRVLPGHWSQWFRRELCRPIYNCSSKWWDSGIRFKMGRKFIINDENLTWWCLGRIAHIKNTRVWETQDRIGIVQYGDSWEESWTWLSQIEDNGEKKYRAR